MTVYVRHTTKPVRYYPALRPWYRFLDWWQGNHLAGRFWTSRTGRLLIWLVPKLIVGVFKLACWLITAAFIAGVGVFFLIVSMTLGGGALGKASRATRR